MRERAENVRLGRVERSVCGMNLIVGSGSFAAVTLVELSEGVSAVESAVEATPAVDWRLMAAVAGDLGTGPLVVEDRLLVMALLEGSGDAGSVEVEVSAASRLSPLLPCTVGTQPCSRD